MHRHLKIPILTLLAVAAASGPATARAQTEDREARHSTQVGELKLDRTFALDPTAPQVGALPGGLAPAYGQKAHERRGVALRLPRLHHRAARRARLGDARCAEPDPARIQSGRPTLHSPPVVPDDLETFSHTGVVPTTYPQLNFSEGNSIVTAHISMLARQANVVDGVPRAGLAARRERSVPQHPPPARAGADRGLRRRVREPLRHDRRVRRGALRHAAHRAGQRRRRAGHRARGPSATGC